MVNFLLCDTSHSLIGCDIPLCNHKSNEKNKNLIGLYWINKEVETNLVTSNLSLRKGLKCSILTVPESHKIYTDVSSFLVYFLSSCI